MACCSTLPPRRYTLRLLTLDQLGRAGTLTCALELLRRADPERLGPHPFRVGLWVGRSATSNSLEEAQKLARDYRLHPDDPRKAPPVPLVGCPWCQEPFKPDSFDVRLVGNKPTALRVGCENDRCAFCFAVDDDGLPIVVVDEQLYRELPAFVIGTVDKFALLPWRGAAGTLFGRVKGTDGQRFFGHHESKSGPTSLAAGLPPPDLVIQDELHLITGPLGTMVGLYETVIDHLSRDKRGNPPKIIASTATARRAHAQIRALYGRSQVDLFPPQGIDEGSTFFASTEKTEETSRLYVGVAAPGRSVKAVMVRVYSTLLSAAYKEWYRATQNGLSGKDNPGDTYATLVAYFNSLRDLGGAQRLVQEEVAPRCFNLERRHPVQDARSELYKNRILGFDILELTSRQSTDDIRKAKGKLEAPFGSDDGGKSDVLLASSMISVGVDIPRLGLMVMNGQPRTVAEYIQATSRVGRSTPGLVVTLHNLFRPRDRSHFERFTAFHEAFYRMIEASSVTPFSSRAIDRGLAAVTVALARYHDPRLTLPNGSEHVDDFADLPEAVGKVLHDRVLAHDAHATEAQADHVQARSQTLFNDWSAIVHALNGVSVRVPYSPWEVSGGVPLLRTAVDPPSDKDARLDEFRAPTSMRNVEPTVHVWVNNRLGGES